MPDDVAIVEEAALIMGYHVRMGLGSEAAGCRLAPMTPAGEHSWPPPIANVTAVVVRLWSDAAGHVTHRLLSLGRTACSSSVGTVTPKVHPTRAVSSVRRPADGLEDGDGVGSPASASPGGP